MADLNLRQTVSPAVAQRTVLVGRVKMAQAIKMPESEWAKIISEIEKDPLFQELVNARAEGKKIVRYKRFGRTGLSNQFYEMQDTDVVGGQGESLEGLLDEKRQLLKLINKVGQEAFEKYFLFREEGESLESIAQLCHLSLDEAKQLQDFVLDMSVQAEFFHPSVLQSPNLVKPIVIGKIVRNEDGTYSIAFFAPHLARGMYEIDRAALRRWQKAKHLDRQMASKLRRYVGLLELSNLKQGAFWRVIDYLLTAQKAYLDSRDPVTLAPVSLRKVAAHLQFAPSTISRVIAYKSILLPWEREVLLTHLMPGQRKVVLSILEKMLTGAKKHLTDMELALVIEKDYGVKVSRRTITTCRHALNLEKNQAA